MSITIQLKPEMEARLLAQASEQGVSVEQLLETLIEGCVVSLEQEQEKPDHMADLKDRLAKGTGTFAKSGATHSDPDRVCRPPSTQAGR